MQINNVEAPLGTNVVMALGDFDSTPVPTIDGFGKSMPITSKAGVVKEALKVNNYSNYMPPIDIPKAPVVNAPISMEVDNSVKDKVYKPVMKTGTSVMPLWANCLTYGSIPLALVYIAVKNPKAWGSVAVGLVAAVATVAPTLYYTRLKK